MLLAFSKIREKNLFSLSFFVLAVFAVLRYDYGNDYQSYMYAHNAIRGGWGDPFESEISFTFINKIIPNYYLLIAVLSIFFLYVVNRLINSNLDSIYKGLAVLVFVINPYLFLMNLSAIRQCIAMCILILSLKCLKERKLLEYVLMVALASTFHTSAIVLFPLYFFVNDKKMNRIQAGLLVSGMVLLLFEGMFVTELIETGLKFFNNSDYVHHFSQDSSNSLRATVLTGIYFIYVAINLTHLEGYKLICGKLYLIGLFFGMIAFHYSMFTRLQMYFDIFSVIALPAIIEYYFQNATNKLEILIHLFIFPFAILGIYIARYFSFFANPMWSSFSTYHTIFEALL